MQKVADFDIYYQQYLDAEGQATQTLPEFAHDPDTMIALYRNILLTRTFDARCVALQRTGRLGTYPPALGQEAIPVAIGHAMQADDVLSPYYRENAAYFQRGVQLDEVLTYWGGDEIGSAFEHNAEDIPITVPIASQCLLGVGIATAFKIRQQARAVVTVCGDGATSKGDFYEAMNLAGDWQLPCVFVINNNQWAISVPRAQQTHTQTLAQKGIACGVPGVQVDGNDVIAVHHALDEALAQARAGGGPTVIEALTYRLCDHTTADDASRYVDADERAAAEKLEPSVRLRAFMQAQGYWDEAADIRLREAITQEVDAAVAKYRSKPNPLPTDMIDYMYAELPLPLVEQREEILANAAIAALGDSDA